MRPVRIGWVRLRPARWKPSLSLTLEVAAALAIWELAGRMKWIADGALPAPSAILVRLWIDWADYPPHLAATLTTAAVGFLIGNAIGIVCGTLFAFSPVAERLFRGVNVAIFALPAIAIVPVLVLTLPSDGARIVLAALGCYFTTMTATMVGLASADPRGIDVVRGWGGGRAAVFRYVRLPAAVPAILSGLQVGAPNALLGSILAEFGGGGRWGLGAYLIGSLGRAEPDRLWGIGLVATACAAVGYAAFGLLGRALTGSVRAATLPTGTAALPAPALGRSGRLALAAGAVLMPFALWWGAVAASGLPAMLVKSPLDVFAYLTAGPRAEGVRERLIGALAETLPPSLAGVALGVVAALLLAVLAEAAPRLARLMMPLSLFTQAMPLVALTPILVLVFGRGTAVMLAVTVSVTFFPAYVLLAQGLAAVPQGARDLGRAYGASRWRELRLIALPAAVPHLFAAIRLAAPRAILGVMIAEWLATGTGLGNLLNRARGMLDYGMIWSVAVLSVLVSVALYELVSAAEGAVMRRRGG
ncbi:ABC transporter permease [Segnochrobactrum spirostomi]|uniref:ABC transporter permease subunit n=1 Tax=Segnochrobactrum spirostomi TaxID=2608987 RepID=A0A6A7Y8H4_9HYPH|nr:ABC transporter permease subunit [Segnochrobactrum spirostomi]MQT14281.1 ABC transporter permease subunit [Segnochrobactrum spirostomi]